MYEIKNKNKFIGILIDPLKNPRTYIFLKIRWDEKQKWENILFLSHPKILNILKTCKLELTAIPFSNHKLKSKDHKKICCVVFCAILFLEEEIK